MCVYLCERECVCERERECVYLCERERECVCVCVCACTRLCVCVLRLVCMDKILHPINTFISIIDSLCLKKQKIRPVVSVLSCTPSLGFQDP